MKNPFFVQTRDKFCERFGTEPVTAEDMEKFTSELEFPRHWALLSLFLGAALLALASHSPLSFASLGLLALAFTAFARHQDLRHHSQRIHVENIPGMKLRSISDSEAAAKALTTLLDNQDNHVYSFQVPQIEDLKSRESQMLAVEAIKKKASGSSNGANTMATGTR